MVPHDTLVENCPAYSSVYYSILCHRAVQHSVLERNLIQWHTIRDDTTQYTHGYPYSTRVKYYRLA